MKFLADMGVSKALVRWLKEEGHDVVHCTDIGFQRATDEEIVALASKQGRVILTCDLDFGDIMASLGKSNPSIILFRLADQTPGNMRKRLAQVLEESHAAITRGAVIVVETRRHRVRLLPI